MATLADIKKDFAQWYQDVIYHAQLADHSPVRGSFIIRPYGCALWEQIQRRLDQRIKETGHQNALFPLFIPESFIKKEAQHVEGFAPELAIVTHAGGKELEEPLVVRPTSETIIHYMFAKWIHSWRDLPLKINQWANVVRWEMRPRAFLRTTEFFWQEGHTAHATLQEASDEVQMMLAEYVDLAHNWLAIPVITGLKSETEKFPGAVQTYTFETLMQDGKALQMGTSHLLSQSFAHAFDMKFQDQQGTMAYPYLTSWGTTTRLVGALVMVHGDQKGLILPPKIAPIQVVIIPIFTKQTNADELLQAANAIYVQLQNIGIRSYIDSDTHQTPGAKFYNWELKGVPVRIEIGMRDLQAQVCIIADRLGNPKQTIPLNQIVTVIPSHLMHIQTMMFQRAQERLHAMWYKAQKLAEFGPLLDTQPGLYQTGWCQDIACEEQLKVYKASTRCLVQEKTQSHCFYCEKPSKQDVLIARSY
ncbi:MAG TPA: proline--tRNA ligase [Candidatus Babeliales bacterium]|jgi:prolyl-tRNA synthetase|nr:proline--tRNA ligase [Candidatus Babeliales bacterium]